MKVKFHKLFHKMFHVKHFPPGLDIQKEKLFFGLGMCGAFFYSWTFVLRYLQARTDLFLYSNLNCSPVVQWIPVGTMEPFEVLLGNALIGFLLLAIALLGFAVFNYAYFWQGSKSIYLVKRLPDRMELHKMAWELPIRELLVCGGCAFGVLVLYYVLYMTATPKECLLPNQWPLW